MTFPVASAIIIKHSANVYRGIAQLVEQRSPKPRAVSSKLTTPAITPGTLLGAPGVLFFGPLLQKIAFSANLCLTTGRLSDIIEHVPAVRCRTNLSDHGPVAQLVRAPACHAGGRRFEPDPGRHLLL